MISGGTRSKESREWKPKRGGSEEIKQLTDIHEESVRAPQNIEPRSHTFRPAATVTRHLPTRDSEKSFDSVAKTRSWSLREGYDVTIVYNQGEASQ
jgi:hypothetical protein